MMDSNDGGGEGERGKGVRQRREMEEGEENKIEERKGAREMT